MKSRNYFISLIRKAASGAVRGPTSRRLPLRSILGLAMVSLLMACKSDGKEPLPGGPEAIMFSVGAPHVVVEPQASVRTRMGEVEDSPAINNSGDLENRQVLIYGKRYTGATMPWSADDDIFMRHTVGKVVPISAGSHGITYDPLQYYTPGNDHLHDFKIIHPAPGTDTGVEVISPTQEMPMGLRVDLNKRPDFMIATREGVARSTSAVGMHLDHLLTRVSFQIVKDDGVDQSVYLNRFLVSGIMRGKFDVLTGKFKTPNLNLTDPDADAVKEATILAPGFNMNEDFKVPAGTQAKPVREMFFFPVEKGASVEPTDFKRYFFDVWLNERHFSFHLPHDLNAGWKPGEHYTYTIRVTKTDVYIELDGPVMDEPWHEIPADEEIIVGGEESEQGGQP